jgi:PKHD-type hydroxylase
MLIRIEQLLDAQTCEDYLRHIQANSAAFEVGAKSAGWQAASVKRNEQLAAPAARKVLEPVREALMAHEVFVAAARPKAFVKMMVSRYRPGMAYGAHVDDALIAGVRTDLSFTLFLSRADSYAGGALVIEANEGDTDIRLDQGGLILYPATSLHRVTPVTEGERVAVVGWVRSLVRRQDAREILFDLDNAIAMARAEELGRPALDRLIKVKMNLLRLWAED